jgi:hypothetical protein
MQCDDDQTMKNTLYVASLISLVFSLFACAAELVRSPATLVASSSPVQTMQVSKLTVLDFGPGLSKQLLPGSRWALLGSVTQGKVYKPIDSVLTIHGANAHEAYLVVEAGRVVGFYLPGERAWSALEKPAAIEINAVP